VLARLPVLLLAVGLAVLVARWAACVGGTALAAVALGMLCLEPNLLAHGHLATLDAPLACFWWLALWQWRGVLACLTPGSQLPWGSAALFAVAVALAVFTKLSGIVLLPAVLLVGWLATATRRGGSRAWVSSRRPSLSWHSCRTRSTPSSRCASVCPSISCKRSPGNWRTAARDTSPT